MPWRALLLALGLLPATSGAAPPLVNVCWDYGCDRSQRVVLPAGAWAAVRSLFTPAAPDPASERLRIARFERAVGPLTGTDRDRPGNIAGAGEPGQMDCIDESRNTTGYLHVLAEHGLLAWHRVGRPAHRMRWLIDQHRTAVIVDRSDGVAWAVDSWFLGNGRRPYVQRLDAWRDMEALPPNEDAPAGREPGPRDVQARAR